MPDHTLPLPPSANKLVRPALLGKVECPKCHLRFMPKKPQVRLVSTGEAKSFRQIVHAMLAAEPLEGPVEIFVTVYVDTLSSDGRNREKALDDALNGRLYFDDKQIAEWHGCKIVGPETGIVVTVVPADPVKHAELARRLARSMVGELAAEGKQSKLELVAPPAVEKSPPASWNELPESLQDRLKRLAKPATYRPTDGPDDAA